MSSHSDVARAVTDNPAASRYELHLDGRLSGIVEYRGVADDNDAGHLLIPHVEVLPELRGRGYSEPFLDDVLADIDRRGLKIVPLCSYARAHVANRPHLQAIVVCGD
jgi:uncharacterized protein